MKIIGSYVNIEGEIKYFCPGTKSEFFELSAAICFIEQPEWEALRTNNNILAESSDPKELFGFLDVDPAIQQECDDRTAAAKAEQARRGTITYTPKRDGLTEDAASYDVGTVEVEVLDEAGYRDYLDPPHEQKNTLLPDEAIQEIAQSVAIRWPAFFAHYSRKNEDYAPLADLCSRAYDEWLDKEHCRITDFARGQVSRIMQAARPLVEAKQ